MVSYAVNLSGLKGFIRPYSSANGIWTGRRMKAEEWGECGFSQDMGNTLGQDMGNT